MPGQTLLEASPAMFRDGYEFISKRCERYGTDVFETRVMLRKTICMRGPEASRLFYDADRFMRESAAPGRLRWTLLGSHGVQNLDGEQHRRRKSLFMEMMDRASIERIADISREQWMQQAKTWPTRRRVKLFDEASLVLFNTAVEWAGVRVPEGDRSSKTRLMSALIDGPGGLFLRYARGLMGRRLANHRAAGIVREARRRGAQPGSPLARIADHREPDGRLLGEEAAAEELLNIIRPIVAVARYVVFGALALHEYPTALRSIRTPEGTRQFVQEVRRYYPFFPFAAARVRRTFEWRGFRFPRGRRVLLDLYGTCHDPEVWDEPDRFDPSRFENWEDDGHALIPQGGGDFHNGHRCAGEWITISLLQAAMRFLTESVRYTVPRQNLRISLMRLPALPKSGFVVQNVELL